MSNMRKRICIIRSNPIKPDSRVEKEAWTLTKLGYDIHILAWDRDSNHKEEKGNVVVNGVSIPITRLGYKATFGEGFKNIIPFLQFQCHMRQWLRKNNFDVVHACDFDTAFSSIGIARKKHEKFVFDIFDFLFGEPHNFFQYCVKKAQYKIINKADATIICTEERKEQIAGSKPHKLAVVHNTPSMKQLGNKAFLDNEGSKEKIKVVYVGILQDFRLLIEVTNCIVKMENVEFHVGGFGKYSDYFQMMANKNSRIKFYGRLLYGQTLELERNCDIMLAIYDPNIENHRYAAPNKFYEGLMLGKPLIMARKTGMSEIVKKNSIGVLIDYSEEGFALGLEKLIACKEKWPNMSMKMQALYEKCYNWGIMEKRLATLYQDLLFMQP